ncbi:cupredoxin domain-containing protein [Oscillatoria sp. CS-180]|uniref:cupredoxin domain-containing protein n=1 Tax=Oscillatoria sp. CS-180 TaxID=3021720 RepID=UPI00232F647F|nr:cupredoxin domain-containing protein [Oscillatoria sp. CS-180]MDB9525673.1 cupredoxin domain-containing protein [Oscillatoria sp. CS-180]
MRCFHKLALSSLTSLGLLLTVATGSPAQMTHEPRSESNGGFRRIEQPLWAKALVTTGGLGLIGLELWWFVFSQPKLSQVKAQDGIQEITIEVDGGYEPNQIVVQAGLPVRLNFHRTDPSSCLEEVRLPDFRIAKALPVNQTTAIEFTPDEPGRYEFACGMNMFRGIVEVVDHSLKTNSTDLATVAES